MTDPGLTNRLRQHSRRAGLAIGLSMAMTIAVCLGGFVVIYAEVDPFLSDFIAAERATSTPERERTSSQAAPETDEPEDEAAPTEAAEEQSSAQQPPPTPTPTPEPQPTPTSDAFEPDYQANSEQPINFRAGPSTAFEALTTLTPAQALQYLNEDAPSENPAVDGERWMKFRTEDGLEGWIREIDAEPYQE